LENFCFSCFDCNNAKGSDIASSDPVTGNSTYFFNPRLQQWDGHFKLNGTYIEPLSPEARVTVIFFDLNSEERIWEREMLLKLGRYPCISS
jgi:hypothetical protein